jgi:hypothetical protein
MKIGAPELVEKQADGRYAVLSLDRLTDYGRFEDEPAALARQAEVLSLVEKGLHVHELVITADDGTTSAYVTSASSGEKHAHVVMVADQEYETARSNDSGPADHKHDVEIGDKTERTSGKLSVVPVVVATTKSQDGVPEVLTYAAARAGELPPAGDSGLPASLERDIPAAYRYWLVENRDAAARVRLALVKSGIVSAENLEVVDGELRRVIRKREVYVPDFEPGTVVDVVVPEARPAVAEVVEACGVGADALVLNAVATRAMGAEVALKTARAAGVPWVLEFGADQRDAVVKAAGGEALLLFELPWTNAHVFLSSALPAGGMSFALPVDDRYAREVRQRANMEPAEIRAAGAAAGGALDLVAGVIADIVEADQPSEVQKRLAGRAHVAYVEREQDDGHTAPEVLACFGVSLDEVTKAMDVVMADESRQRVLKLDEERRIVFSVVMEPGVDLGKPDAHGEGLSAETIERSAYDYIANYGTSGLMHKWDVSDLVKIVDFHIVREDVTYFGQLVHKGSLIMGWKVEDDALWELFKNGTLRGFSFGGYARKRKVRVARKT